MMMTASTALTTRSGTVVNNKSPNGMPRKVETTSRLALPRWIMSPVLHDDDPGDRDRDEGGHRRGHLDGNDQGEQRHGHECLAEPECGADQGGEENHGQHGKGRLIGSHLRPRRACLAC